MCTFLETCLQATPNHPKIQRNALSEQLVINSRINNHIREHSTSLGLKKIKEMKNKEKQQKDKERSKSKHKTSLQTIFTTSPIWPLTIFKIMRLYVVRSICLAHSSCKYFFYTSLCKKYFWYLHEELPFCYSSGLHRSLTRIFYCKLH